MRKSQLLGEILVARNVVTGQDVDRAINYQKSHKCYIGEILIQMGLIEEKEVVTALGIQYNVPYIQVDRYDIGDDVIKMIPKDLADKYHIVPLEKVGNILSVVMLDPINISIRNELSEFTACKISPFIATRNEIDNAIQRYYNRN